MYVLSAEQIQAAKRFIFENGRLLERQLFEYFFGHGTREASMKALMAYQNPDGGFGNGIEPDLLCPDSTAIGAETAMYVMDILDFYDPKVLRPLVNWIMEHQNQAGHIAHPPIGIYEYPCQPWWTNPDADRVLSLAGLLRKFGVVNDVFYSKTRTYFQELDMPIMDNYYCYPYFVYLKYCSDNEDDRVKFASMVKQTGALLDQHADHFPLFSRAWYHANDCVSNETVVLEARKFVAAMQEDGGLDGPYPELKHWRPIFTLDGLIQLKRLGLL